MLAHIRSLLVQVLSHRAWAGIAVVVAIILAFFNPTSSNGPPPSPGVYLLHDIFAGKRLTRKLVEVRGDIASVNHRHPVELKHVIGLCLTMDIRENTQLTLEHLEECPASSD